MSLDGKKRQVNELKRELQRRGLDMKGQRGDLIKRLNAALEAEAEADTSEQSGQEEYGDETQEEEDVQEQQDQDLGGGGGDDDDDDDSDDGGDNTQQEDDGSDSGSYYEEEESGAETEQFESQQTSDPGHDDVQRLSVMSEEGSKPEATFEGNTNDIKTEIITEDETGPVEDRQQEAQGSEQQGQAEIKVEDSKARSCRGMLPTTPTEESMPTGLYFHPFTVSDGRLSTMMRKTITAAENRSNIRRERQPVPQANIFSQYKSAVYFGDFSLKDEQDAASRRLPQHRRTPLHPAALQRPQQPTVPHPPRSIQGGSVGPGPLTSLTNLRGGSPAPLAANHPGGPTPNHSSPLLTSDPSSTVRSTLQHPGSRPVSQPALSPHQQISEQGVLSHQPLTANYQAVQICQSPERGVQHSVEPDVTEAVVQDEIIVEARSGGENQQNKNTASIERVDRSIPIERSDPSTFKTQRETITAAENRSDIRRERQPVPQANIFSQYKSAVCFGDFSLKDEQDAASRRLPQHRRTPLHPAALQRPQQPTVPHPPRSIQGGSVGPGPQTPNHPSPLTSLTNLRGGSPAPLAANHPGGPTPNHVSPLLTSDPSSTVRSTLQPPGSRPVSQPALSPHQQRSEQGVLSHQPLTANYQAVQIHQSAELTYIKTEDEYWPVEDRQQEAQGTEQQGQAEIKVEDRKGGNSRKRPHEENRSYGYYEHREEKKSRTPQPPAEDEENVDDSIVTTDTYIKTEDEYWPIEDRQQEAQGTEQQGQAEIKVEDRKDSNLNDFHLSDLDLETITAAENRSDIRRERQPVPQANIFSQYKSAVCFGDFSLKDEQDAASRRLPQHRRTPLHPAALQRPQQPTVPHPPRSIQGGSGGPGPWTPNHPSPLTSLTNLRGGSPAPLAANHPGGPTPNHVSPLLTSDPSSTVRSTLQTPGSRPVSQPALSPHQQRSEQGVLSHQPLTANYQAVQIRQSPERGVQHSAEPDVTEAVVQDEIIVEARSVGESQQNENTASIERADRSIPIERSDPSTFKTQRDTPPLALRNRLRAQPPMRRRNKIGNRRRRCRNPRNILLGLNRREGIASAPPNREDDSRRLAFHTLAAVSEFLSSPYNQDQDPRYRLSTLVNTFLICRDFFG
ncbi:uncharacterized protein LOC119785746 isoform X2 [Cyprinodon tularosa]|uniref:uncharacterized protein LOC119785746 isoform X2 n=1 Tax=Cyprinodon tularosa TaxID=77115 RepID=UPI0018E2842D|nr:uncharacterized protein LOC119785746 isoform X2 [Cyprinodon tularosa]